MIDRITSRQIKKIWACSNEVKLNKEALYKIVYGCSGKDSIRQLTKEEAYQVIEILISKYNASRGEYKTIKTFPNSHSNVISLMSPGQKRKIVKLMYNLNWNKDILNEFSNKIVKKRYNKLTKEQASILIKALKAVLNVRSCFNILDK